MTPSAIASRRLRSSSPVISRRPVGKIRCLGGPASAATSGSSAMMNARSSPQLRAARCLPAHSCAHQAPAPLARRECSARTLSRSARFAWLSRALCCFSSFGGPQRDTRLGPWPPGSALARRRGCRLQKEGVEGTQPSFARRLLGARLISVAMWLQAIAGTASELANPAMRHNSKATWSLQPIQPQACSAHKMHAV